MKNVVLVAALLAAAGAAAQQPEIVLAPDVANVRALLRAGDEEAAVDAAEAIVEERADDASAWQWLGHAYGQQALAASMFTKASWAGKCRDAYQKAVELDPKDPQKGLDLLNYYINAPGFLGGGEEPATAEAARLATLDAGYGHLGAGLLAQLRKDDAAAEREYRAAVGTLKDTRRARMTLANFYASQKRWGDVRGVWTTALESNSNDPTAVYMVGRTAAVSGEELETGLAHLDRYLALETKDVDIGTGAAHWRKGLILEKLGRVADAIAEIRKAVELDPKLEDAKKDLERLL